MSKYNSRSSLPVNFEGFINARQPQDVFTFFDDFMGCSWGLDAPAVSHVTTTTAGSKWLYTGVIGGGTTATAKGVGDLVDATYNYPSTMGGILRITTTPTADYGCNLQGHGTPFVIDADIGLPLYFETRFRTADISNTDILIGLANTSASGVGHIHAGCDDFVGFLMEAGVLYAQCAESSQEYNVNTGITEADGAAGSNAGWIRAAFMFDGKDTVTFSVDSNDDGEFDFVTSVTVSTTLHYLPDDVSLTPTIEVVTGTTDSAETADIDYVYCCQQRYHA